MIYNKAWLPKSTPLYCSVQLVMELAVPSMNNEFTLTWFRWACDGELLPLVVGPHLGGGGQRTTLGVQKSGRVRGDCKCDIRVEKHDQIGLMINHPSNPGKSHALQSLIWRLFCESYWSLLLIRKVMLICWGLHFRKRIPSQFQNILVCFFDAWTKA